MATILPKKRTVDLPQPNKRSSHSKIKRFVLHYYTLFITLTVMIVLTCFFYLSAFNHISTQGVIINELEQVRSELIIENEVWNMRIAKLKSLDVIEEQDVVNRMPSVDPKEIEFIDLDRREKEEA